MAGVWVSLGGEGVASSLFSFRLPPVLLLLLPLSGTCLRILRHGHTYVFSMSMFGGYRLAQLGDDATLARLLITVCWLLL